MLLNFKEGQNRLSENYFKTNSFLLSLEHSISKMSVWERLVQALPFQLSCISCDVMTWILSLVLMRIYLPVGWSFLCCVHMGL